MFCIVGLGNPGEQYLDTRHNTGRDILDYLNKKTDDIPWKEDKSLKCTSAKIKLAGKFVLLVKPDTFMNKSGDAVRKFIKSKKEAQDLVVIHDDLDMPIGRIKMVFNRGAGGHRGVESISRAIKTEAFIRIKVGISKLGSKGTAKKPQGEKAVGHYILGKFSPSETKELAKINKKILEALEVLLKDGREIATSVINNY